MPGVRQLFSFLLGVLAAIPVFAWLLYSSHSALVQQQWRVAVLERQHAVLNGSVSRLQALLELSGNSSAKRLPFRGFQEFQVILSAASNVEAVWADVGSIARAFLPDVKNFVYNRQELVEGKLRDPTMRLVSPGRDLLNDLPSEDFPFFPTCAIVGNSGALLHGRWGALIDAHDAVVRFNSAVLNDSTMSSTGNRTTLLVLNAKRFHEVASCKADVRYLTPTLAYVAADEPNLDDLRTFVGARTRGARTAAAATRGGECGAVRALMVTPSWASYRTRVYNDMVRRFGGSTRDMKRARVPGWRASMGLSAVLLLLPHCHRVSLFGFSPPSVDGDQRLQDHYWADDAHKKWPGHSWAVEGWILRALAAAFPHNVTIHR